MTTIHLDSDLGIENAEALRARLAKPARSRRPVTLVAERIDRLHCAALQVLCAFVRDRAAAHGTTTIVAPSELRSAAALLGVAELLGLNHPEENP